MRDARVDETWRGSLENMPTNAPTETPPATPWRTTRQAAARAQVSPKLLYREVKAGRLRHALVGGRRELRFRDEWIDHWLEHTAAPIEGGRGAHIRDLRR